MYSCFSSGFFRELFRQKIQKKTRKNTKKQPFLAFLRSFFTVFLNRRSFSLGKSTANSSVFYRELFRHITEKGPEKKLIRDFVEFCRPFSEGRNEKKPILFFDNFCVFLRKSDGKLWANFIKTAKKKVQSFTKIVGLFPQSVRLGY